MKLFAGLRKIRLFERGQLPVLRTLIDFDIVIEIGYEEERGSPVTLKKLYLLKLCSPGTLRRKLNQLTASGIVIKKDHPTDGRSSRLLISPTTFKQLCRYSGVVSAAASLHFTEAPRT
jgi:hypothetical protein